MIGLVDIGLGNLGSLEQAVYSQGWDPVRLQQPDQLNSEVSHLILPGVGAFFEASQRLQQSGWLQALQAFAAGGRPLMGICLGMQLLASEGDEGGKSVGLGLIPGRVKRLDCGPDLRIPHVGWNEVHFTQGQGHPMLGNIANDVDFYFVHSYQFLVDSPEHALATTPYGQHFNSIVARGNVIGLQFHPEKSQTNGLRLLDNFCLWDGQC
ncbi:MAG TPA: imidazole glycerol phosphate synthase subunit HisH [Limnobacter sp.]|nr:imidazole glycerol phosphate synthase subunit HisH [Limnobacter sp.]